MTDYTATAGSDTFVGTTGDDTFIFPVGTNTSGDSMDGDAGEDIVRLTNSTPMSALWDLRTVSLLNIERLLFDSDGQTSSSTSNTAIFFDTQFDTGLLSTSFSVTGSNYVDTVSIVIATGPTFSAATWTFASWGTDDVVLLTAFTGAQDVTGSVQKDMIIGGAGDDVLAGGDNNDVLAGDANDLNDTSTTGNDTLSGGLGNDILIGGVGDDNLNGGDGVDYLVAGTAAGSLSSQGLSTGPIGADIGVDTLDGGAGDDVAYFDFSGESDVVTMTMTNSTSVTAVFVNGIAHGTFVNVESVSLRGGSNDDALSLAGAPAAEYASSLYGYGGADALTGGASREFLEGGDGDDTIVGGGGDDELTGGAGADDLDGGDGRDWARYVNDPGSLTINLTDNTASGGNAQGDTFTSIENLSGGSVGDILIGNSDANTLWGNSGDDQLEGRGGNDSLSGDAGADTMLGGEGDDTYSAVEAGDTVTELANEGEDTVRTSLSTYTLGANFERLSKDSSTAFTGTGNELANTITGNNGDDTLSGLAANDTLNGGFGNDSLVGGAGADTLNGDEGNDTISYTDPTDIVSGESFTGNLGTDRIAVTGTSITFDLTVMSISGVEELAVFNTATLEVSATAGLATALSVVGNDNGNAFIVVRRSTAGTSDLSAWTYTSWSIGSEVHLYGTTGVDTLIGTGRHDRLFGGDGDDTLTGGDGNDVLTGGIGNDVLTGGIASDTLIGGVGDDIYYLDGGETITELLNEGTDIVYASGGFVTLANNVENGVLTGTAFSLFGNSLANTLTGNAAMNSINGGAGNDTIYGGAENDSLAGGADLDMIYGEAGTDTIGASTPSDVVSGETYDGGAGTDYLQVSASSGTFDFTGVTLVGFENLSVFSASVATFNADVLGAGLPANLPLFSNTSTPVVNFNRTTPGTTDFSGFTFSNWGSGETRASGSSGNDTLIGSSQIDRLVGNDGADTLTGNASNDVLTGGLGNDILDGGAGTDTMTGGTGDDTYYAESSSDSITEVSGEGTDTVYSNTFTYGMGAHVEIGILQSSGVMMSGNAQNNTITGNSGLNTLQGGDGADTLYGGTNNDTLYGNTGVDTVYGEAGNDTIGVNGATDVASGEIYNGGDGTDQFQMAASSATFDFTSGVTFVSFESLFIMSASVTTFSADVIGAGFAANMQMISNTSNVVVNFTRATAGSTDISAFTFTNWGSGQVRLFGSTGADQLTGSTISDRLEGGDGSDTLDGGAGADAMFGGAGQDMIFVDNVGDTVDGGADSDTIWYLIAGTFDLGTHTAVENMLYTGSGSLTVTGTAGANILNTMSGNDTLYGLGGDDRLVSNGGVDSMYGGTGNDEYMVDDVGDTTVELTGEGTDIVAAFINHTLSANIENLTLEFSASNGTGNELANVVTGNASANVLNGMAGADTLNGGDGADTLNGGADNDTLNGGLGADILAGGLGDDTYTIADADTINESSGEGTDTVLASITHTLGANLERLTLTGATNINGTGNADANLITGNSGANTLQGGDGADTLYGGDGDDVLSGDNGADFMYGEAGSDLIYLGEADYAAGGIGNDDYQIVSDVGITIFEASGEGSDTVTVHFQSAFTLGDNLDNLYNHGFGPVFTGTGNGLDNTLSGFNGEDTFYGLGGADFITGGNGNDTLFGGDGADDVVGGAGNDVLDGGAGADQMLGGSGDDTFFVDDASDQATESSSTGGDDTVYSSTRFTIGANIERLILTGSADNGAGNTLNNTIIGNAGVNRLTGDAGDDILDGGLGADELWGGEGSDTYYIDNASDLVVDVGLVGVDHALVSVSWVMPLTTSLENATLTGSLALDITGNNIANTIVGNSAINTLDGGAGNDWIEGRDGGDILRGGSGNDRLEGGLGADNLDGGTGIDALVGGAGDDVYTVDDLNDDVIEVSGEGADLVYSSATWGIRANVEYLFLTGMGAINAYGDGAANVLVGNDAVNLIGGFDGNDWLEGRGGNDDMAGGAGLDRLEGGAGNDTLDGQGGIDAMFGGDGNDIYCVDEFYDDVIENSGEGADTVLASVNWGIRANVENLFLVGSNNIDAFGDNVANVLVGNDANNSMGGYGGNDWMEGRGGVDWLSGGDGDDRLEGGAGNDTLEGQAGWDTMIGGAGDDVYFVENVADDVRENIGEGNDIVFSSVTWSIRDNVETVILSGGDAINAYGSGGGEVISGNGAANVIAGFGGIDWIEGFGGADWLEGGAGDDRVDGGAGADRVDGGTGADVLIGGAGADSFVYNTPGDSTTASFDSIRDFEVGIDKVVLSAVRMGASDTFAINVSGGNTILTVDLQGNGSTDVRIELVGITNMTASDIIWS